MPVQQGMVGPIPKGADAEDYDKLRRRVLWKMPSGLYVIGSRHDDRLNLMTASWVSQVSFDPKLVAVSVEMDAAANTLNGFPFHAARTGAPVLDQAVAYLDCEVRQAVEVGNHTLFLGEVVDSAFQHDEAV